MYMAHVGFVDCDTHLVVTFMRQDGHVTNSSVHSPRFSAAFAALCFGRANVFTYGQQGRTMHLVTIPRKHHKQRHYRKVVDHMLQLMGASVSAHPSAIAMVQVQAYVAGVCVADVMNAQPLQLGVDEHRVNGQTAAHQVAHDVDCRYVDHHQLIASMARTRTTFRCTRQHVEW